MHTYIIAKIYILICHLLATRNRAVVHFPFFTIHILRYHTALMTAPDAVTRAAQSLLFSFLWKNKKDKMKRNVVWQLLENGDLNFINFEIMVKSLRLAWIARLISNSDIIGRQYRISISTNMAACPS